MLKVFNTLGRKKEEFKPLVPGKVSFYHCGPTVYWTQHIGNMRAIVLGDLIRKSLLYMGYDVKYVMNYTDFGHLTSDDDFGEDKMAKGSKREGISPEEVANKYIEKFERDRARLNVMEPSVTARATGYLDEMVKFVQELLDKGYAYPTPTSINFDTAKLEEYPKLSGQVLEKNIEGAGHGSAGSLHKKRPQDFVLWMFRTGDHAKALQYWESPFESSEVENGEGFPGWHIECSAMARKTLGERLDIHMGGIEHIPTHHPNEIAQSESANDVQYVNYWLHNEHIKVDGGKMSKSEGNAYALDDLLEKGYKAVHLRYFFLQSHYRSSQNFTWKALDASRKAYDRLVKSLKMLGEASDGIVSDEYKKLFLKHLEDDFNVPAALSVVWDVLKSDLSKQDMLATILDFDRVLGLNLRNAISSEKKKSSDLPEEIKKLAEERKKARADKNWELADRLREEIENQGYDVVDTSKEMRVVPKSDFLKNE